MRGGILDCRCARRSARRQVGTKGWSYSDRTKGWALELNSTALAYHVQFAELDAHNSDLGAGTDQEQYGGLNISASVCAVHGDIVGRDKIGLDEEKLVAALEAGG